MSSSRSADPRKRGLQMNAGSQIHALLHPERPKERGPNIVNHAHLNRQNLKATQLKNQIKREEEIQKATAEPFKMNRFKNVSSAVKQKLESGELTADNPHAYTRKGEGKGVVAKLGTLQINQTGVRGGMPGYHGAGGASAAGGRTAAGQYADENDDENLYYAGNDGRSGAYGAHRSAYDDHSPRTDRYDSDVGAGVFEQDTGARHGYDHAGEEGASFRGRYQEDGEETIAGLTEGGERENGSALQMNGVKNHGGIRAVPAPSGGAAEPRSFVSENARKVIAQSRSMASARHSVQDEKEAAGSNAANIQKHQNYGKVPAYLQEQKAFLAKQKEDAAAAAAEKASGIPDGMVLMPEDQRVKTLEVLQDNHKKVLQDLAAFPLRVETASRKKAKAELEAKLEEIEKAIQLFSRKRVLIQP